MVHKSYGSVPALKGVSLHCEPGEVFALLGPNGAGKSTTIGIATGVLRPDSGSVKLVGIGSPQEPSTRVHIGVATQSIALYDELNATENLRFFGRLYGLPRETIRQRSADLLERVGLDSRAADPVHSYSGGMKRRLNLAVALIHDPKLVLLDEPTAGVDPQSRNAILDLVTQLGDEGRTVIYSTHYMEEAQRVSDRVAILDHGSVIVTGTVDELIASHGGQTRVRRDSPTGQEATQTDEPLQTLATMLALPDTLAIHVDRPDLEAVFFNLTGRSLRDP
jgi:ABC-2 type transport system ATP-binding protein